MADNLALITSFLLSIRAGPDGAGEMERGVMQQGWSISNVCMLSACVCMCVHVQLALLVDSGCLSMFSEKELSREVSHYQSGWMCRVKCVELDVDFLGRHLKSVFGLEVVVWVLTQFFCG